jgi:hypothetical protein
VLCHQCEYKGYLASSGGSSAGLIAVPFLTPFKLSAILHVAPFRLSEVPFLAHMMHGRRKESQGTVSITREAASHKGLCCVDLAFNS